MGALTLAAREMLRRSGRFVVLAAAIAVLVFFVLFQQGLLSGLVTQFVGAIRNQDAPVLVYSEQARKNLQSSVVTDDQLAAVAEVDGVAAVGPLGVGTFTVDTSVERTDAQVFGYELGAPGAPKDLESGRYPEVPGEAVVDAAAGAGFEVGDTVTVTGGGPEITIVGTGRDLAFSVLPTLFVSFDTYVDARLAQNPDAVAVPASAGAVAIADGVDPDAVADRIAEAVPGTDPLTRAEAEAEAPGVAAVQQSFSLILLLGYVVVAVVIGFFFLILTTQKLDQLTILRALGVSSRSLGRVILSQVLVLVVVAFAAGGTLALLALSSGGSGIDASLAPSQLVGAGFVILVLALLATIGSLRRIRRLDPARAVELGGSL